MPTVFHGRLGEELCTAAPRPVARASSGTCQCHTGTMARSARV